MLLNVLLQWSEIFGELTCTLNWTPCLPEELPGGFQVDSETGSSLAQLLSSVLVSHHNSIKSLV